MAEIMGNFYGKNAGTTRFELIDLLALKSLKFVVRSPPPSPTDPPPPPVVDVTNIELDDALVVVKQSIEPGDGFEPATTDLTLDVATYADSFEVPKNIIGKSYAVAEALLQGVGRAAVLREGNLPNVSAVKEGAMPGAFLILDPNTSPPYPRLLMGATITLVTNAPPPAAP